MGLPADNASGYAKANVLTYCKDLTVPLLIIHGTADDNVYSVNSLKMVDALFRAGKKFEFIPLGGMTHAVNEPETVRRLHERIATFFIENLNP
jgi:dipeptidyl-peptidase-4